MPLKIYLDTSDYSALYRDTISSDLQRVLDFLLAKKASGEIEIGFSYPIVWELLQDFSEEYRADRVRRAAFIRKLCDQNAYRYLTELKNAEAYSQEGHWYPALEPALGVAALKKAWIEQLKKNRQLIPTRAQRNALKNPRHLRAMVRKYPQICDLSDVDLHGLPITEEFISKNMFYRYMAGEISEKEADREFLKILTDPVVFLKTWFDGAGMSNPFTDLVHRTSNEFAKSIETLREVYAKSANSLAEIKKAERDAYKLNMPAPLIRDIKSTKNRLKEAMNLKNYIRTPKLTALLDDHMLEVLLVYFETNLARAERMNDSDFADLLHAAYIPHADLWRGDSAFAHSLIRGGIALRHRVVPTLTDLPTRITDLLGR